LSNEKRFLKKGSSVELNQAHNAILIASSQKMKPAIIPSLPASFSPSNPPRLVFPHYSSAHRIAGKDLSNNEKLRYTLDNAGRTIQTQTFDAQNNLATPTSRPAWRSDLRSTKHEAVHVLCPRSSTSATYDGLNRVKQRIDANNKITTYQYNPNGNVTAITITDPNSNTILVFHDDENNLHMQP
jgi:YD repeat-containing protein